MITLQKAWQINYNFNPIQDGVFLGCSRMEGGTKRPSLPKICHTYPAMMKPGSYTLLKEDAKNICDSRDAPLEFC